MLFCWWLLGQYYLLDLLHWVWCDRMLGGLVLLLSFLACDELAAKPVEEVVDVEELGTFLGV